MKRFFFIVVMMLYFTHDLFSQCAMCKAVAEEEVEEEGASGINAGILYIMAVPYIILFFVFRKKIFSFLRDLKNATGKPVSK